MLKLVTPDQTTHLHAPYHQLEICNLVVILNIWQQKTTALINEKYAERPTRLCLLSILRQPKDTNQLFPHQADAANHLMASGHQQNFSLDQLAYLEGSLPKVYYIFHRFFFALQPSHHSLFFLSYVYIIISSDSQKLLHRTRVIKNLVGLFNMRVLRMYAFRLILSEEIYLMGTEYELKRYIFDEILGDNSLSHLGYQARKFG